MVKNSVDELAFFGGPPVFSGPRSTSNLQAPPVETFFAYTDVIYSSGWLTNNGPLVRQLEARLAVLHETAHAVAVCSGFMGLMLAIHALGLPGRTEVLLPTLTYRRLADIVVWAGFTPRFCDVEADTLGVSAAAMEPCISGRTALLLPAHPMVHLCDIDGITALGEHYGLPVLFDAVEAAYASHKGRMVGSFGNAEVFSLHASKLLSGFEGGYITTNDDALAARLRRLRSFGFVAPDRVLELGLNAKLNEVHAAMALGNLDGLTEQVAENREKHLLYERLLRDIPGLYMLHYDETELRGWKNSILRLGEEWPLPRDLTILLLHKENMIVRGYYPKLLHKNFACSREDAFPVSDVLCRNHLMLPCGAFVSLEDIERIAQCLCFLQQSASAILERLEKERHSEA